jgi:hypothetical protein
MEKLGRPLTREETMFVISRASPGVLRTILDTVTAGNPEQVQAFLNSGAR